MSGLPQQARFLSLGGDSCALPIKFGYVSEIASGQGLARILSVKGGQLLVDRRVALEQQHGIRKEDLAADRKEFGRVFSGIGIKDRGAIGIDAGTEIRISRFKDVRPVFVAHMESRAKLSGSKSAAPLKIF